MGTGLISVIIIVRSLGRVESSRPSQLLSARGVEISNIFAFSGRTGIKLTLFPRFLFNRIKGGF